MSTLEVKAIQAPTGYDLQMPAGHILQVIEGSLSTKVQTTATSATDTGLSATITPSSSSNKVLVRADFHAYDNTASHNNSIYLKRGSVFIGNSGTSDSFTIAHCGLDGRDGSFAVSVLDSPNTTSAITYKIQFNSENATDTAVFNDVSNGTTIPRAVITLMEVSA
jgi:hypothetical protein